ncbi:MAG: signal peptide peptidase SppA [Elusimicrobia bacterium]|nr:signal peptide peptidase SppA [Elusimicrobiota bacterium]
MTRRRLGLLVLLLYLFTLGVAAWFVVGRSGTVRAAAPSAKEAIAVVELQGPITFSMGGIGGMDVNRTVRRLRALRERRDVKAVLLRINSPGGSVAAVQEIHQEILSLRESGKSVIASVEDVAASGGYYIAAASDKIVANPGSLTGSIGVIFQLGNMQGLMKKIGVRVESVVSGDKKDAGSPFRPLTREERRLFQDIVNEAYEQFFRAVAEGRKIPEERLRPLADGRIFIGTQAKEAGLVDELGNFETALRVAKETAGITAERPALIDVAPSWERFFDFFTEAVAPAKRLPLNWPTPQKMRFEYVWE